MAFNSTYSNFQHKLIYVELNIYQIFVSHRLCWVNRLFPFIISSVTTTEIYARADTALKREALEKANPLKNSPSMPQWKDDEGLMDWFRNLI